MPRRLLPTLALFPFLLLPAAPRLSAEQPPRVRLCWIDTVGIDPTAYASMVRELDTLFARMGLELQLRNGKLGAIARPDELRVVLLERSAGGSGRSARVLGAAGTAVPERIAWIYYPRVREFAELCRCAWDRSALEKASDLGVALGRVVAHELVHVLAPELAHVEAGLMARQLSHDLKARIEVDPATREAVVTGARALAAEIAGAAEAASGDGSY